MTERSAALYDFAVLAQTDAELSLLPELLVELGERFGPPPPMVELLGKPDHGDVLVLFRFSFARYSSALRQKMTREAGRLRGRLVEPELLSEADRTRFYAHLGGFPVREDASALPNQAVQAFRVKMGLHLAVPALSLHFDSAEDLAAGVTRAATAGRLFVPARKPLAVGAAVKLWLTVSGVEPLEADGRVLEVEAGRGFWASLTPGPGLTRFLARQAAGERQGRQRPEGGRRVHPRIDCCLEVSFRSSAELKAEYALNISRGGVFVRTESPPPLRSQVRLQVTLPGGEQVETEAEVVHAVTPAEAYARRCAPGVGLCFATGDTPFHRAIGEHLARLVPRRPRVLVADGDRFLREVLKDALQAQGLDAETVGDGQEALVRVSDRLLKVDLLVLDLALKGLDGFCLIGRIRALGPEAHCRMLVFAQGSEAELAELVGPDGADAAVPKGTPMDEVVEAIRGLLERS